MSDLHPAPELQPDAAAGFRFAVVTSAFNATITERLRDGAVAALAAHGAEQVLQIAVPGAYELPMAAHRVAAAGKVSAVVCCGALIRGETPHFDVLAHSAAIAMQDAVRDTGVPITFGLITCDTMQQALARCGGDKGNKGAEAALAAIEMAAVFASIGN